MGTILIKKQSNNTYRFTMKAANAQTILTGEPCRTKEECMKGIEALRIKVTDPLSFEFKRSFNHKHYFNVLNADGAVIGSSEMYESSSGRDVGIVLVKVNAPDAVIEDLTS